MLTTGRSKTTRSEAIRKVRVGLEKYYGNVNLVLAGTSFTPAALQAFLQTDIDANDASTQAKATWLNMVKVAKDTDIKTNPVLRAIEAAVRSQYGEAQNADTVLADFGYSPRKVVAKTVATKTVAVAKTLATREARQTMGKRQKAKVKGTVPVTVAEGASASGKSSPAVSGTPGSGGSSNASPAAPAAPAPSGTTTSASHP